MPLRALNQFNISKHSDKLIPSEYRQEWKCPYCPSKMSFVDSRVRIKHFRHLVLCPYQTERESKEHIDLKAYIYENLKDNFRVEYEHKIGNNITDVVVFLNSNNMVAVECQVSPISIDEFEKRNRNYEEHNAFPIWILHSKNFTQRLIENFEPPRLKPIERENLDSKWLLYYDDVLNILERIGFKPKINPENWITTRDGQEIYVPEYECKTIFNISDIDVLTPNELINEACEYLDISRPSISDMELDTSLTIQDMTLEEN